MRLLRFMFATLLSAATTFFFAGWARNQSEAQIGKMQMSAYNTPGSEAPVPPHVFATGMSTLGVLWFVLGALLRVPVWQRALALVFGAFSGVAALFLLSTDEG